MNLVIVGITAAVALLALAWAIAMRRRRPSRIDTPEAAASATERAINGFAVAAAVVGADGAGALTVSADNRVAALAPAGRAIVAREVGWSAVRSTARGIVIDTGDRRIGQVALAGVDILDIRRLAASTAAPAARVRIDAIEPAGGTGRG